MLGMNSFASGAMSGVMLGVTLGFLNVITGQISEQVGSIGQPPRRVLKMGVARDATGLGGMLVASMAFVVFALGGYQITNRFANDMVDAVRGRLNV